MRRQDQDLLFAENIAELRHVSIRQAERYLVNLERRFGEDAVRRVGVGERRPRRCTSRSDYARLMGSSRPPETSSTLSDVEDMLESYVRQVADLERRLAAVERRT